MRKLSLLVFLCAIVVACQQSGPSSSSTPQQPHKGSKELAAQLFKISDLHVLYAEGLALGYRDSASRDRKPAKEINCVMTQITPELALPVLADAYSLEFSDNELSQAIAFFESKAGKDYIQSQRAVLREMSGTATEQVAEVSSPEAERITAFAETRIGKIIMAAHSPVSDSVRETLRPKLYAVFDQCRNAQ